RQARRSANFIGRLSAQGPLLFTGGVSHCAPLPDAQTYVAVHRSMLSVRLTPGPAQRELYRPLIGAGAAAVYRRRQPLRAFAR
ncbi:hypothetical protein C7D72_29505, partial [Klebsiella pneumoniae]